MEANNFRDWQADYAAHGIPTVPVEFIREGDGIRKKPMVGNAGRFGLVGSSKIASKFATAPGIGFMCGRPSGITVLDWDSKDERGFAEALDRHGATPLIARTASGKLHAYYRHNGERRWIKPWRDVPIDILGGELNVAPPSQIEAGRYEFIQGSLDDLAGLPALHNLAQGLSAIINERLLAVMKRVRRPVVEKPAPGEIFWKWSARDRWKEWQEEQAWKADLVAADALVGRRFWTPLHFDFRGRINPIPHFNFQREDHVRALFLFADGAPIGHEGLKWLKAHVARSADGVSWSIPPKPSKLDLAGRIAWTDKNLDLLCKIGRAVLDGADPESIWWALPADDEPYQFLAACAELVEALDKGPEFETKLPVVFDATCSGLQHYSGMLRSEEGRLVNLTKPEPGGERVVLHLDGDVIDAVVEENGPSDFYGVLAVALWMKCWREAPGLCDLMVGPLDRKIVKTPVMSYFYGATRIGMSEQILEIIKKRNKKLPRGEKTPVRTFSVHKVNGISYGKFASIFSLREVNGVSYGHFRDGFLPYMHADALYGLIGENAPKAVGAMNFLRGLAESAASHNESLRWTTPLGFPVVNAYYEPDTKRIGGRRIRRTFVIGDKNEVDRDGAMDAIAANFVHAADAALLQLVALAAEKEGIPMVSVHDCYGTIAPAPLA